MSPPAFENEKEESNKVLLDILTRLQNCEQISEHEVQASTSAFDRTERPIPSYEASGVTTGEALNNRHAAETRIFSEVENVIDAEESVSVADERNLLQSKLENLQKQRKEMDMMLSKLKQMKDMRLGEVSHLIKQRDTLRELAASAVPAMPECLDDVSNCGDPERPLSANDTWQKSCEVPPASRSVQVSASCENVLPQKTGFSAVPNLPENSIPLNDMLEDAMNDLPELTMLKKKLSELDILKRDMSKLQSYVSFESQNLPTTDTSAVSVPVETVNGASGLAFHDLTEPDVDSPKNLLRKDAVHCDKNSEVELAKQRLLQLNRLYESATAHDSVLLSNETEVSLPRSTQQVLSELPKKSMALQSTPACFGARNVTSMVKDEESINLDQQMKSLMDTIAVEGNGEQSVSEDCSEVMKRMSDLMEQRLMLNELKQQMIDMQNGIQLASTSPDHNNSADVPSEKGLPSSSVDPLENLASSQAPLPSVERLTHPLEKSVKKKGRRKKGKKTVTEASNVLKASHKSKTHCVNGQLHQTADGPFLPASCFHCRVENCLHTPRPYCCMPVCLPHVVSSVENDSVTSQKHLSNIYNKLSQLEKEVKMLSSRAKYAPSKSADFTDLRKIDVDENTTFAPSSSLTKTTKKPRISENRLVSNPSFHASFDTDLQEFLQLNADRPHFVASLMRLLQLVNTDFLRQQVLYSTRKVLSVYDDEKIPDTIPKTKFADAHGFRDITPYFDRGLSSYFNKDCTSPKSSRTESVEHSYGDDAEMSCFRAVGHCTVKESLSRFGTTCVDALPGAVSEDSNEASFDHIEAPKEGSGSDIQLLTYMMDSAGANVLAGEMSDLVPPADC